VRGNTVEKHTWASDYFDLDVEVTDEGDVGITFRFPEAVESIAMEWDDLREVIEFVGKHGLAMKEPYLVEYDQTIEGAEIAKEAATA